MKKHNLFKVISITILITLLLTWVIQSVGMTTGEKGINPVGIFDLFNYIISSVSYFGSLAVFILVVAGFYGVLNKTGAYEKLIHDIALKFRKNEKIFIVSCIIILALLTSITGLSVQLFVIIPLLISLILYMGYSKLIAISSTFGAILIGTIGSIYSNSITTTLGLKNSEVMISNAILLVVGIALLVMYILKTIKTDKKLKKTTDNVDKIDPLLMETGKSQNNYKVIIIILSLIVLISILGVTPWTTINDKWTAFDNFHNWLFGLKIGNFEIVSKLFGSVSSFGNWLLNEIIIVLVIASLLLKWIYKIKFNEFLEAFFEGCKKLIPTAALIIFLHVVLVISTYHPFFTTVTEWALDLTKNFNVIIVSLLAMISSVLNIEMMYVTQSTLATVKTAITDNNTYSLIAVIFQSLYGVVMLIAPTSILLVLGLGYLNVDYKTWIKYIWKFIIQLLIFLLAAFIILLII